MNTADWTELACSNDGWTTKRQNIISNLNTLFGDGFAQPYGDFILLRLRDGRTLQIAAVSPVKYRLGNHLDLGNHTGTPVAGDKLIHHIGSFVEGSRDN